MWTVTEIAVGRNTHDSRAADDDRVRTFVQSLLAPLALYLAVARSAAAAYACGDPTEQADLRAVADPVVAAKKAGVAADG